MHGGGHLAQTRDCTLSLCQKASTSLKRGSAEEASCKDLERVVIDNDPEKFFQVRVQLPPQEKQELIEFLRENVDCLPGTLTKPQELILTLSAIT